MQPSTCSAIVQRLQGVPLTGAIRLANGMLALVFDNGQVIATQSDPFLLHPSECGIALRSALERLREENAELYTLTSLVAERDDEEETVSQKADRLRDEAAIRPTRRTATEVAHANGSTPRRKVEHTIGAEYHDAPAFLNGDIVGLGRTDVEQRARTEQVAREIPDIR